MTVLSLHPFEAKRIRIAEEDDLMVASMEEGRIIGGRVAELVEIRGRRNLRVN